MPELPEVETVRRVLAGRITGRRIYGLRVGSFTGVLGAVPAAVVVAQIIGREITAIQRRGKYLYLMLDEGAALRVHLRMTGRLLELPREAPPVRFEHLVVELDDGHDLRFADQRKFGRVELVSDAEIIALDQRLGPEPLEPAFTAEALARLLANRSGPIKSRLLDQRLIAGLGNIYVDEALFRARIHPERPGSTLTGSELRQLHRAIRAVLRQSIANRGTTVADFQGADGDAGGNQAFLQVYGRAAGGQPCPRCGRPVERIVVGGRGTHLCPHCQRR